MKRLTTKLIETALLAGWKALSIDTNDEEYHREKKNMFATIKLGEDAENHVGYAAKGYFAIEESYVMSYYYDFPHSFYQWEEAVNNVLRLAGYFLEPKNHCEYCIFPI